ncbi:MAG: hypothetical protein B6I36_10825, partial [Desulfobacteraceae bacterium 4572_35.1]
MLKKLKLRAKIVLAMFISIVIVCIFLVISNVRSMSQLIYKAERHELETHMQSFTKSIAMGGAQAKAMSALVAGIPAVQEKFYAGDREALKKMFLPNFKTLKEENCVAQFQFLYPPATS